MTRGFKGACEVQWPSNGQTGAAYDASGVRPLRTVGPGGSEFGRIRLGSVPGWRGSVEVYHLAQKHQVDMRFAEPRGEVQGLWAGGRRDVRRRWLRGGVVTSSCGGGVLGVC